MFGQRIGTLLPKAICECKAGCPPAARPQVSLHDAAMQMDVGLGLGTFVYARVALDVSEWSIEHLIHSRSEQWDACEGDLSKII